MMRKESMKKLRPVALVFGVITLFIFLISFAVFYTTENFSSVCGCQLPMWVIIVVISSLGLFAGFITYYLLSGYFIRDSKERKKDVLKLLCVLDEEEGKVLMELVEKKGEANQSYLSKRLNIGKVRMSRVISRMEKKKMIEKEKNNMTNKIRLHENIKSLLIEE